MRAPAGVAANTTSATIVSPAVAIPRRRHGGPPSIATTSRRSASPGRTGRRKRAFSTATMRSDGSLLLVLGAAALGGVLLVRRGVVDLHDLVGHIDRLVVVEQRPARGLEHERVPVLLPVVADDVVELLHDAGGELGVGALQ